MPVSEPWSGTLSLTGTGDGASLSTERPLKQQDGVCQEQGLGGANGSQLRDPSARHGRNNLQQFNLCPLVLSLDELMQKKEKKISNSEVNLGKDQFICRLRKFFQLKSVGGPCTGQCEPLCGRVYS